MENTKCDHLTVSPQRNASSFARWLQYYTCCLHYATLALKYLSTFKFATSGMSSLLVPRSSNVWCALRRPITVLVTTMLFIPLHVCNRLGYRSDAALLCSTAHTLQTFTLPRYLTSMVYILPYLVVSSLFLCYCLLSYDPSPRSLEEQTRAVSICDLVAQITPMSRISVVFDILSRCRIRQSVFVLGDGIVFTLGEDGEVRMGKTLFYALDGWICVIPSCDFAADRFYGVNCCFGGARDNDVYGCFEVFLVL